MGSNVSQTIKILESGMGSLYATVKIWGGGGDFELFYTPFLSIFHPQSIPI